MGLFQRQFEFWKELFLLNLAWVMPLGEALQKPNSGGVFCIHSYQY